MGDLHLQLPSTDLHLELDTVVKKLHWTDKKLHFYTITIIIKLKYEEFKYQMAQ